MEQRGQAKDRHGRTWTATALSEDEAEEADFRFWYEGLSPEERVNAVQDCLLSCLKAKGIHEIPRLRKVARVLKSARVLSFVGHSNTIPELLVKLGATPDCYERIGVKKTEGLEIEGYDRLWKVDLKKQGCAAITRE